MISGKDNPKVKYLKSLHDRKKASRAGVVYIEGTRLCDDSLKSGVKPEIIAYIPEREELVREWCGLFCLDENETELLCISRELFEKISSTENPQGVSMVVKKPTVSTEISSKEDLLKVLPVRSDGKSIYAVLETLQDPGNLGTIIRMADAFALDAVIMTSDAADPYNEKVLRATMGSVWHLPLIRVKDIDIVLDAMEELKVSTLAMHLKGDSLSRADIKLPAAFFIGNEGNGLTDKTTSRCTCKIKIPMPGKAESLNAATAASIIGFVLSDIREK